MSFLFMEIKLTRGKVTQTRGSSVITQHYNKPGCVCPRQEAKSKGFRAFKNSAAQVEKQVIKSFKDHPVLAMAL